nr:monocarboxylate transporter 10 isoform X2 [Pogona vitticeps]
MSPVSQELGAGDAAAAAAASSAPLPPLGESGEEATATGAKLGNGEWCPPGEFLAAVDSGDEVALITGSPPEKNGKPLPSLSPPSPPPPPPSPPPPPAPPGPKEDEAFEPPEGGWGWLVMLAAMWCNGTVFGIQNSCGILFNSMLKVFGDPKDPQLMFRTALVNSLSMGMIFFCSPIVSIFTNIYGCRTVAVVGAAVAFIGLLSSSFVRPLIPSAKKSGEKSRFIFPPARKMFNFSIFKITSYRIWAFGIPAALFGYFIPYVHLLKHVKEHIGDDVPDAALLLCLGITSGIGRLIFGRIADYIPGAKKVYLQVISFFFIGLMSMMIPLCYTFGGLIAVCLFMGLFDGCFISIMAPIAFELVGAQYVSQAIGFLLGFMSIPMTVGPPIAGKLRDHLGTYNVAFYLAGIPPIVGGVILCFIPWVHEKEKNKEQAQATPMDGGTTEKMLENKSISGLNSFVKHSKETEFVI